MKIVGGVSVYVIGSLFCMNIVRKRNITLLKIYLDF